MAYLSDIMNMTYEFKAVFEVFIFFLQEYRIK